MNNFKGTKGKWVVYNYQGKGGVIDILPKNEDINTSQQIAQVFNRVEVGISSNGLSKNSTQVEADALLISKAPELLKMLELLVDRMEENDLGNFSAVKRAKQLIKEATEI
jgi:hypothetical protein